VTPEPQVYREQPGSKEQSGCRVSLVFKALQALKEPQDKLDFKVSSVFKVAQAQQVHKVLKVLLASKV
jgi:hypothetical protein